MRTTRKIHYWKLRTTELQLGERTLVMGVLNVTPDSFTDGGRFLHPDQAYARALELEEQGADVIDLGGESTRPESKRVSAEEEWQRLAPVLKRLRGKLGIPVSIDTYKAETAARALEYDVEIINDPSGLTFDSELAKVVMEANAGLILNHMRGTPESWGGLGPLPDPMGTVLKDLDATASRARRAGVEKNRIMVDPGLGFGKRKEQNSDILAQLGRLAELDYPILVGPSRKSFLAHLTADEAAFATAAAVTAAILSGAHMVRVHDVKAMKVVVAVADEIARLAAAVANKIAEEEDAEWQAKKARGFGPKPLPPYMVEERVQPMRPPLAKVVKPVVVEPAVILPVAPVAELVASPAKAEEPVVPTDEIKPEAAVAEAAASASSVETSEPVNELPRSAADDLDDEDFDDEDSDEDELAGEELDIDEDDESADGDESEESADAEKSESAAPVPAPHSDTPAKAWGAKKPSDAPIDSTGDRQRPLREGFDPPRRAFGPPKPFGDRPPRRDFDGPRKVFSPRPPQGDRPRFDGPPRGDGDRSRFDGPPRRDFGGPPPRRNFDGPPPRREGGYGAPQGDRPRFDGPPPRRDFGGPPPRRDGGGYGPPRGDGDRPPRRDYDGPPRRDFDGPPKRNVDGPPQRSFDGPPKRSFDGPPKRNFDGPPKRNFDGPPPRREGGGGYGPPPRGDGPPRRDFGDSRPPRNFDGPPPRRDDGPSGGRPQYKPYGGPPKRDGGGPPFRGKPNDRPFRPSGPRPDGDRPGGGGPGGDRPYGSPGGKLFRKRP